MSRPDVERAMRTLAATADSRARLPDADMVWERAATRGQWRLGELATRPIRLAERVACVVCGVTGVVALLTLRPDIEAVLRTTDQTLLRLAGMTLAVTAAVALALVKSLMAEE